MNEKSSNRKYVCRYHHYVDGDSTANFISNVIGQEPERYEIISILMTPKYTYNLFYKEYLE